MKQSFYTAAMVVGMIAIFNQFEVTKNLLNGGNKFFN